MLALMEAAERRERAVQDDNSDSDAEEYDDTHRVLNGIESMSSVCGTYVVRDNEGLAVFEKNPHDLTLKKIPSYLTPPPMLRYGQRVQVVGMENDVYKLARNEGYVVADHTQLVKVGVPLEESCKVEGLIRTVQSHKANLHKKLQGLEQAEDNLKFELDELLDKPPQHPVIEDFRTVLPMELEEEEEEHLMEEDSILGEDYHREGLEIGLSLSEESLTGTPTPSSPPGPAALSRQVLFLNDEETAISDTMSDSGMRRRSESPITRGTFICGGSLFPALRSTISDDDDASRRSQRIRRVGSSDLEDASTRDPDRVDFRTGLSGHIALNIPKRSHTALQKRRNVVRLMGEHRGIAPMRNMRKSLTDSPH